MFATALVLASALGFVSALLGCQGLAGRWTGELVCSRESPSIVAEAELRLWRAGEATVEGELRAEGEQSRVNVREETLLAWTLSLERTDEPGIRQPLQSRMDRCVQYVGGRLDSEGCALARGEWRWDGEDGLELDGERCRVELQRGAKGSR